MTRTITWPRPLFAGLVAASILATEAPCRDVRADEPAPDHVAAAKRAYTLSDRGTWLSFEGKGDLAILNEGDAMLLNPYGVILVNPDRFSHVKAREGQIFIDWLLSDEGQQSIGEYQIGGEQLFFPNAAS